MLPFVTTWMEPEDVMLSEISQIETNTLSFHLYTCMSAQSYLTLCNPMDCSLPASAVYGFLQARILE